MTYYDACPTSAWAVLSGDHLVVASPSADEDLELSFLHSLARHLFYYTCCYRYSVLCEAIIPCHYQVSQTAMSNSTVLPWVCGHNHQSTGECHYDLYGWNACCTTEIFCNHQRACLKHDRGEPRRSDIEWLKPAVWSYMAEFQQVHWDLSLKYFDDKMGNQRSELFQDI